MDRRGFLRISTGGMLGLGLLWQAGCKSQTAQVKKPGQADMVGSHTAGAEVYKPLIDEAVGKLLARHSQGVQPAAYNPSGPQPMRICFVGVENKSIEEMGDFKEQIYQAIDTRITQSGTFQTVSRRFVDAGLQQARLRPDMLFIPQNMRDFSAAMERQGQPFDYLLYATLTSGTTHDNRDYQRDYLLTLEMVSIRDGSNDKEAAELSKAYNRSAGAKMRAIMTN
jgi:hypothetical protein